MVDYSKWNNIELSDDEEICPYVDKDSFKRVRRQQKEMEAERVKEEERFRVENQAAIAALKARVGGADWTPELAKELADREGSEVRLAEAAAERAKKFKWNADNMCTVKWESTRLTSNEAGAPTPASGTATAAAAPARVVEPSTASGGAAKGPAAVVATATAGAASDSNAGGAVTPVAPVTAAAAATAGTASADPLEALVEIPLTEMARIQAHIKRHARALVTAEVADQLGILAIRAVKAGREGLAKRYLHHSYVVKYCIALGSSGGSQMFFDMYTRNKKESIASFEADWRENFARLKDAVLGQLEEDRRAGLPEETNVDYSVRGLREGSTSKVKSMLDTLPADVRDAIVNEDAPALMAALERLPPDESDRHYKTLVEAGYLEVEPVADPNDPAAPSAAADASSESAGVD